MFHSEIFKTEVEQIGVQEDIRWIEDELNALDKYAEDEHRIINGILRQNEFWNDYLRTQLAYGVPKEEVVKRVGKLIRHIDNAMKKSKGMVKNTKIYRACDTFDHDLKVGQISSFKGYASCSYQEAVAEDLLEDYPERYKLEILCPAGQKGIALNDERLHAYTYEHEFLLPRNQRFKVLTVDHESKTARILLIR